MEDLRELLKMVTIHKEKVTDLFTNEREAKKGIYSNFANYLLQNPGAEDEDCAKLFCSCDAKDKKYLMLKSRLRRKLMNTIYFFDIEKKDYSAYAKADFLCNKLLAASGILLALGARAAIVQQVKKGLHTASKFHMNKYAAEFSRLLTTIYAEKGDIKHTIYYSSLNQKFLTWHLAESKLLNLASYIISNFKASATPKPFLAKEISGFLELHEQLEPEGINNCFMYAIAKFRLRTAQFQLMHTYERCISTCNAAEKFILNSEPHFYNRKILAEFYMIKLGALTRLREYTEGIATAQKYSEIADRNSIGWLLMSEYYFIFLLHTGNYTAAYKLYLEVTSHLHYKSRPKNTQEKWRIFNYYLHFIAETGWDTAFSKFFSANNKQKLRPAKLLNDLEVFHKDKSGFYITVLILYFLILLHRKQYQEFSARTDALKAFMLRRNKKDLDTETFIAIKMLLAIEKAEFKAKKAAKGISKFHQQLSENKLSVNPGAAYEIVLLPYQNIIPKLFKSLA